MYCRNCGKELDNNATFCPVCGVKTVEPSYTQPVVHVVNNNTTVNSGRGVNYIPKNKWVAFFLCLFLGYFGAHRFYVGKTGTGILWLLTCGVFGIGWFFDLILILVGAFRDKAGQPLK